MKKIDMRFDVDCAKNMIGKEFVKYRCDRFDFTNSVTQIVGIYVGNKTYSLTNIQDTVDYYGTEDEISVYRFLETSTDTIRSAFADVEQVDTPVNSKIERIRFVNERQTITEQGKITYDVQLTRAVIFCFNDREISFEKDVVPFSEEIIIRRGYDLVDTVTGTDAFYEGWPSGAEPKCVREVIEIS